MIYDEKSQLSFIDYFITFDWRNVVSVSIYIYIYARFNIPYISARFNYEINKWLFC